MFKLKCLRVAIALLSLTGCTGVAVSDSPGSRGDYSEGDFQYATSLGAIRTEVAGNPFDIPADAFRDAVLKDMQGHARDGTGRFVAEPTKRTIPPYKIIVAFDMPRGIDGYTLCKGRASLPAPVKKPGATTVSMAFCFGDVLKSDAYGTVSGVKGVNDPHFVALVQRTTEALIPSREDAGPDAE